MEVIKHGNTYKEIECVKCGAILAYCKSDIKVDHTTKYLDIYDEWYYSEETYVTCPECRTKIKLS